MNQFEHSKSEFKPSSPGSFSRRGGYEFPFNVFKGSDEENKVRKQEEEGL